VSRSPVIRRDTVGTFESRLRWSHRWRWLAPTLAVALAVAGAGIYFAVRNLTDPQARRAHERAMRLALRDDVSSLEEAASLLDEASRAAPRLHAARADRALVDFLLAEVLADEARDLGGAAGDPLRARSRLLATRATEALDGLGGTGLAPAEVARARAVGAALEPDRGRMKRLATEARGRLANDPLVEAAEQSAEIRLGDVAARDRATTSLALLVARQPDVIRARYVLARGLALTGRRAQALATLRELLDVNPHHEGAMALRDSLTRLPPATGLEAESAAAPAQPAARTEKPAPSSGAGAGGAKAAGASGTTPSARPAAKPSAEPAGGTPESASPGEPEPAPRLRPAAVPEPEPVEGGG
jgi:hypothetical protein